MSKIPMAKTITKYKVRWLRMEDLDQIYGIEHAEYPYPYAFDDDDFEIVLNISKLIAMVATPADSCNAVAGYMFAEECAAKYEILNLTSWWKYRKDDTDFTVWNHLMDAMLKRLNRSVSRVIYRVAEDRLQEHLHLRDYGFKCVRTVSSGCSDHNDLLVFRYSLKRAR